MSTTTIFSPAQLAQIVNETIPSVTDASHRDAIVAGVDLSGAQVLVHFQKSSVNGWEMDADAVARHNWTGDSEIGAQVVMKW